MKRNRPATYFLLSTFYCLLFAPLGIADDGARRPRLREAGITIGVLSPGPLNAITDVDGVRVGQVTLIEGEKIRTGVTAILPHGGNVFLEKVPGAIFVGNGFGKLAGSTQVRELGQIETPILLTSTLNVPRVADGVIDYMLSLPGMEEVRSINPVVGETNDGQLNDIRSRPIGSDHVRKAIESAKTGPVEEGSVGAGTGTIAFGFKGGIGTSSRKLPEEIGGWTVGVLVQSNFGGVLRVRGVEVGQRLGRYYLRNVLESARRDDGDDRADGSIMIVVATDAPLDSRNLERLAARAIMGLARTGAAGTNGSGDYVIAFSNAYTMTYGDATPWKGTLLSNDAMSPLFLAAIEATEEAILNSLFKATAMTGNGVTVEALPVDEVVELVNVD